MDITTGVASVTRRRSAPTLSSSGLIVTTTSDNSINSDGVTSLREAVAYAESGNAGANPVVTFAPGVTGSIALASAIVIDTDVTITGPGASNLTVNDALFKNLK